METKTWKDGNRNSFFIQTEINYKDFSKFRIDIFKEAANIIVEKLAQEYLNRYQDEIFKKLSVKQIRDIIYKAIAKEIEKRLIGKKERKEEIKEDLADIGSYYDKD